ncbi:MAG: redoxin domain-containing protein [Planctomycetaceae bacterium]|nr:redoxin domain-containing protein [Planctomycetaceae bacterium]
MRFKRCAQIALLRVVAGILVSGAAHAQQKAPTAEQILKAYRPSQSDVEIDNPTAEELPKCRVENEPGSYVVLGAAGQVLRRISDTNADGFADQYRYYRMGLEVFRDIDTNKNNKPDQCRWMNWGGTRWGLDQNEDGRIDAWRILSAQEAARIAVESMIRGDVQALSSVMLSADDIKNLKINDSVARELAAATSDLPGKLRAILSSSKILNQRSTWVRFDPPVPGLIPAEDDRAATDLTVYENAMAIVQNGEKHDLVMIGEMVQIGNVWKLAQLPSPLEGSGPQTIQLGGILMQPQLTRASAGAPDSMSEEMQRLLAELQKIDEASPSAEATPAQLVAFNVQRADVLEKLMQQPQSDEDRVQWIRQFAEGVTAATQTGEYAAGPKRLADLQEKVKDNEELLSFIYYRRLLAEYAIRLKNADPKAPDAAQTWWGEQVEAYVKRWPKSESAPEAIAQLAIGAELLGRIDDAKSWYTMLARDYERSNQGIRARGALKRLALNGTRLELQGRSLNGQPLSIQQYRGKVTLVVFWTTWATPFTSDLQTINAIYQKYQPSGFEILGVNLDSTVDTLPAYLRQYGIRWQSIRDAGGMEGQLARDYGIISVPTMFIMDKDGVVASGIATENLETAVQALLKGEKLDATRQSAANAPRTQKN